jgi:hypothetical protein
MSKPTSKQLTARIRELEVALTTGLHEDDNNFYPGSNMSSLYRDRYDYDRQIIFAECLRAWRINPVARRIVKLISMFVVGEGIDLKSDHKATQDFLTAWATHPLNKLRRKYISFCDEATRSGNLFFLCTEDPNTGMLFIRGVPADQVEEIVTAPNDVDQELAFTPTAQGAPNWPGYDYSNTQSTFMLHYAYNQPVGVAWGEPDLAPMLPWIARYATWLEDRARLNHFRNAFMYVVRGKYANEAERRKRESFLNLSQPIPGSVLVTNEDETWGILSATLDSFDASVDGMAIKKMIAVGAGVPLHYLAEPESATRTTAEAAGTPTFRGLEQTQTYFLDILKELATIAVQYRKKHDRRVNPLSNISAVGPDITERDNSILALAVSRIYPALSELFDRDGIDETELLRIVYRMAGEIAPVGAAPTMKHRPLKPVSTLQPTSKGSTSKEDVSEPAAENEPKEAP